MIFLAGFANYQIWKKIVAGSKDQREPNLVKYEGNDCDCGKKDGEMTI